VETFDVFTEDNDPHGECDFGTFDHDGDRIFWKLQGGPGALAPKVEATIADAHL
jgi:hypothetical protein